MKELIKNKTLFVDMDGVIADFNSEPNCVARFSVEKGFFLGLTPISHNLQAVKLLIGQGKDVRILSASPNEQADKDKHEWLDTHLPQLAREKRIIVRNSDNKFDYMGDLSESVLFDDYSGNLVPLKENGGTAIKVVGAKDNEIGTHTKHGIAYVKSLMQFA